MNLRISALFQSFVLAITASAVTGCGRSQQIMLFPEQEVPGTLKVVPNVLSRVSIGGRVAKLSATDIEGFTGGQAQIFEVSRDVGEVVEIKIDYSIMGVSKTTSCTVRIEASSCVAEIKLSKDSLYCYACSRPF